MNTVVNIEKTRQIKFFDILISDIHSRGEDHRAIEETTKITYHEVLEWISEGGDWSFIVTEHNNPEKIFMRGSTYENMDYARKGEEIFYIGEATDSEISDIKKLLRLKRKYDC